MIGNRYRNTALTLEIEIVHADKNNIYYKINNETVGSPMNKFLDENEIYKITLPEDPTERLAKFTELTNEWTLYTP
jgi:hypothetical protein